MVAWTWAGYAIYVETREEAVEELKKFGYDLKPEDVRFYYNRKPPIPFLRDE